MPSQLQDLNVDWVSLVDRAAVRDPQNKSEPRRFLIYKREGAELPTTAKGGDQMDQTEELRAEIDKAERDHKAEIEKKDAELATLTTERDEAVLKAAKAAGEGEDGDSDDEKKPPVKKEDLSPEVRAALEKAEQREADANERLEKAEKAATEASDLAKAEREQRVTREYVAKAEELGALPVQAPVLGPILKSADEGIPLTKEQAEELQRVLKAADEQIRRSDLFKTVGVAGGTGSGADPMSKLQQKAEELRKNDSNLSAAEALDKAMRENPDLEAEYAAAARR